MPLRNTLTTKNPSVLKVKISFTSIAKLNLDSGGQGGSSSASDTACCKWNTYNYAVYNTRTKCCDVDIGVMEFGTCLKTCGKILESKCNLIEVKF